MRLSVLLACVVLSACGTATSAPVADDPTTTASPTPAPTPSPSPSAEPSPSSTFRPLAGFPLVRGYPLTNGDDGTPVEVTDRSGVEDLTFCGRPGWDPKAALDLVGTTYTGEAEDFRGRTLARYAGRDATAVFARLRDAIEACPVERTGGTDQVYELIPGDSVDESFFVTHRYRGEQGFDTGLEVIGVQRLDDLVLLVFEYGEGGGSDESISRSLGEVVQQVQDFMPELCEYVAHPCSQREPAPVIDIGPDGVEGITLGMSAADADAAGMDIERLRTGSGCERGNRDDQSLMYAVVADLEPGVGVVDVWTTTYSRTPEGVGSGSTPDEVEAAYPGTTGDDTLLTSPVPGHPDRAYEFQIGEDHVITWVNLVLTDHRCSG
jgi:hypothetical protein